MAVRNYFSKIEINSKTLGKTWFGSSSGVTKADRPSLARSCARSHRLSRCGLVGNKPQSIQLQNLCHW
jgi:hypothetical protein